MNDPLVLTLNTAAAALDTAHTLSSMSSGIGIADAAARAIGEILSNLLSSLRHPSAPPHVFALSQKRFRKFSAAESSRHDLPFKKRGTYCSRRLLFFFVGSLFAPPVTTERGYLADDGGNATDSGNATVDDANASSSSSAAVLNEALDGVAAAQLVDAVVGQFASTLN